ncbi:MAG: glycogen/starch/alpha-glucan phosphorylase [Planctomycetes bacterium]|nr:glycogen/starch/alpha-glucan phosphorylase [Planctomycetota bacterium]
MQSASTAASIDPRAERLRSALRRNLRYALAKDPEHAGSRDLFRALALAVREFAIDGMLETERAFRAEGTKSVHYLSMEFLMGRALGNNLLNLDLLDAAEQALEGTGLELDEAHEIEPDAALGNGGLGRLAACFLDSLATLGYAGYGYGINYEHGLFHQEIRDGKQREKPDRWLDLGSAWLVPREEEAVAIPIYGRIEHGADAAGEYNPMWVDWRLLYGVPHDFPVVGHGGRTVNFLRLYSARASRELDMEAFNSGEFLKAVDQKALTETVSKVLYPTDSVPNGKELRLVQEYFFVACALRHVLKRCLREQGELRSLPRFHAIQLNDTHPALAICELMRALVDEHRLPWDEAFEITRATCAYTNHTLLPEALEQWSIALLERVLPRHLQILQEIDRRFRAEVHAHFAGDGHLEEELALVTRGGSPHARMAHLAIVGSHAVNGVAELHSELLRTRLVPRFAELYPERFLNVTNGVTPRRWVAHCNPELAALYDEHLGREWIADLERLRELEPQVEQAWFRARFREIKQRNKTRLAEWVARELKLSIDPQALFDVQAKRIHEYKRQLLAVLHVIARYLEIVEDGVLPACPRVVLFAGKAAPGYVHAKDVIELVHRVGAVVNGDPRVRDWLRVVFLPNYRVSQAERLIPAADLSEQISTAGMEASGTGNMKFGLNGALTIGTLDGANIEIRAAVGAEHFHLFGHTASELEELRSARAYSPQALIDAQPWMGRVVRALEGGLLGGSWTAPAWIAARLRSPHDPYFHLADLPSYLAEQRAAEQRFLDRDGWCRSALVNALRLGHFSSDRTIREYAEKIWGLRAPRRGAAGASGAMGI